MGGSYQLDPKKQHPTRVPAYNLLRLPNGVLFWVVILVLIGADVGARNTFQGFLTSSFHFSVETRSLKEFEFPRENRFNNGEKSATMITIK